MAVTRCRWAPANDALYTAYHDEEWGVPLYDDDKLFEMLILEGAQAGLSWRTILAKRDNYREAFDHFDAAKIARYGENKIARLLQDPGIVRNRVKINAAVVNARVFLDLRECHGSFSDYLWRFVGGEPRINRWKSLKEVPANTPESEAMSRELKKQGFKFVGSTTCYAFMQAVGMVNDHTTDCFRYRDLK